MDILYKTKHGKLEGVIQRPHKHENGQYVVSKTRFKEDYIYVDTLEDIKKYLEQGYKVRVSSQSHKTGPSLISVNSLSFG